MTDKPLPLGGGWAAQQKHGVEKKEQKQGSSKPVLVDQDALEKAVIDETKPDAP